MANMTPWTIVLIDDEPGIRNVTGITLEDAGYTVYTAESGKMGLELCRESGPQIVITDVRMPGMDGIAVLEQLKQTMPEVEVIVATAFGEMDLAIRALQLDASDFITKPIHDEALNLALERAKQRYTDRKQLQEYTRLLEEGWNETTAELMETYRFQQNLIESSMDGIIGCNAEGTVVIFNKSMEAMLGYNRAEVRGRFSFEDLMPAEAVKLWKQALAGEGYGGKNKLFRFQTEMIGRSRQRIPAELSTSLIREPEGGEAGFVCFVRDLREMRKLEREMEDQAKILHQDKMMSLGRLAASVVHEINNPLAGVLNYCRLMLRILNRGEPSGKDMEKFVQYLTLVESETGRCSKIISNLLTFSRKSENEFSPVSLGELLDRSVLLSRHKLELTDIAVNLDAPDTLPPVRGDFNQLQQCIINLIFNAADAMQQGGILTLTARLEEKNRQGVIEVSDTGVGIPTENLPRVFEPFFTSKAEGFGVGVGLSTVYGIVERHNGSVDVNSIEGEGTTFRIRLPLVE